MPNLAAPIAVIDGVPISLPEALAAAWEPGLLAFRELRKRYLLYPDP